MLYLCFVQVSPGVAASKGHKEKQRLRQERWRDWLLQKEASRKQQQEQRRQQHAAAKAQRAATSGCSACSKPGIGAARARLAASTDNCETYSGLGEQLQQQQQAFAGASAAVVAGTSSKCQERPAFRHAVLQCKDSQEVATACQQELQQKGGPSTFAALAPAADTTSVVADDLDQLQQVTHAEACDAICQAVQQRATALPEDGEWRAS